MFSSDGKAESKFYMPMNNNMGQTSLQNLWGIEVVTVQMSSSFTFSLLAAWFCVILSCSEKTNEKWTSLIRVTSVVSVSSLALSLLHVKRCFLFILFFPSPPRLRE